MTTPPESPQAFKSTVAAGALAGGGIGTILGLIANNMGDANELKSWFTVLSPPASVAIAGVWAGWRASRNEKNRQKQLQAFYEQSQATLARVMANTHTTQQHKTEIRQSIEAIELLIVNSIGDEVRRRL